MAYSKVETYPAPGTYEEEHIAKRDALDRFLATPTIEKVKRVRDRAKIDAMSWNEKVQFIQSHGYSLHSNKGGRCTMIYKRGPNNWTYIDKPTGGRWWYCTEALNHAIDLILAAD